MPKGKVFQSKAQSAAMHAAAKGQSTIGIPQSVGKKLVAEAAGQSTKRLPRRVPKGRRG